MRYMTNKKDEKNINPNSKNNMLKHSDEEDTTNSSNKIGNKPVLSLRFNNDFWQAFKEACNNDYDRDSTDTSIIRQLFNNWANSNIPLDPYIVIMNYLSTFFRGHYEDVSLSYKSDTTTQKTFFLSKKNYDLLNEYIHNKSSERKNTHVYYKLILGWIVSRMPLHQYMSLTPNAEKLHLLFKEKMPVLMESINEK